MENVVVVVPTIRPECHAHFKHMWRDDFDRHRVTLVTVWDGPSPRLTWDGPCGTGELPDVLTRPPFKDNADLFCRRTDACRNIGFVFAATLDPDVIVTFDDDVEPRPQVPVGTPTADRPAALNRDPIAMHLAALAKRVPLGWMNTAIGSAPYLRGVPYVVRAEAPVMLSHGVWDGVPDFDGETQLRLAAEHRHYGDLPYYEGPIPRGVKFAFCGMNAAVAREALPYLYYAPQGPDSGFPDLHRMADIFLGLTLKPLFDAKGWAVYSGGSKVYHARASDPRKNFVQERLGRAWLEELETGRPSDACARYFTEHAVKSRRYADLVTALLKN